MRRKSALMWFVLFMMLFALASGGCGGGGGDGYTSGYTPDSPVTPTPTPDDPETPVTPDPAPENETIFFEIDEDNVLLENPVYHENVYNADADDVVSAKFSAETDKDRAIAPYEMTIENSDRTYAVGDVIVVPPSEDSAYGFVAVVDAIQAESGGAQTLSLRQAGIGDVLSGGDLFFSSNSTVDSMLARSKSRRAPIQNMQARGGIIEDLIDAMDFEGQVNIQREISISESVSLNADLTNEISKNAQAAVDFKIAVTPKISFSTGVSFYISVKDAALERLKVTFPYEWKKDLGAKFSGKLSIQSTDDFNITPKVKIFCSVVPVGPFPIPLGIDYSTIAKMAAGVEGDFEVAYENSSGGCFGFDLDGKNWTVNHINTKSPGSSTGAVPKSPSLSAEAKFELGPKIFFNVAFVDLVSAKATAGIALQYNPTESKLSLKGIATLNATMDLLKFVESQFPKNKDKAQGKGSFSFDFLKLEDEISISVTPPVDPTPVDPTPVDPTPVDPTPVDPTAPPALPSPPTVPTPPTTSGISWIDSAVITWYTNNPNATSFTISTAAELAGLSKIVSGSYGILSDDFYGKTITLTQDINLAGNEWTPIGAPVGVWTTSGAYPFRGTFNGGGHTIRNMSITRVLTSPSPLDVYAGLFSSNSGTIKDVSLSNVYVAASASSSSIWAGGIAGGNDGTIMGCTVSGSVFHSSSHAPVNSYIGGIVGSNSGTISDDCKFSNGSVFYSSSYSSLITQDSGAWVFTGGITGDNVGTVATCTSIGNVSAYTSAQGHIPYAGGIAGVNSNGTITDCTSSGYVSASSTRNSSSEAGGIAGRNAVGTILNCSPGANVFSLTYFDSATPYAGGVAGMNDGGIIITTTGCESAGNVTAYAAGAASSALAGGIAGSNNKATIEGYVSNASVTAYVAGAAATSAAGGIAGTNNGTITGCISKGKNINAGIGNSAANANKGGFIGANSRDVTLTNNRNDSGVSPAIGRDYRITPSGPSENI